MKKYFLKALLLAWLVMPYNAFCAEQEPDPDLGHVKLELKFDCDFGYKYRNALAMEFPLTLNDKLNVEAIDLPSKHDLRDMCPEIYNQGQLGSCTANALAGSIEYNLLREKVSDFIPSCLFIYYNEREMMGTVDEDSGATLSIGIHSIMKQGACHETTWPYIDQGDKFKEKPTQACYLEAQNTVDLDNVTLAHLNQDLTTLKAALYNNNPIVYGVRVYESFMTKAARFSGEIPMPKIETEMLKGGHAIMLVGYDDEAGKFIFRNSWGTSWGAQGYGYMPYEYVMSQDLASDFWQVTKVGPKAQAPKDTGGYTRSCTLI